MYRFNVSSPTRIAHHEDDPQDHTTMKTTAYVRLTCPVDSTRGFHYLTTDEGRVLIDHTAQNLQITRDNICLACKTVRVRCLGYTANA